MTRLVWRLAHRIAALLVAAAAVELTVGRGMLFLQQERLRLGLAPPQGGWFAAGPLITRFTGLLAVIAVAVLGLAIGRSRFPPAGRAVAAGGAAAVAGLGALSAFVPPGAHGILTLHLAVTLGGLMLALSLLLARAPWDLKLLATLPLLLPPLGVAVLLARSPSAVVGVARGALWGVGLPVAAGIVGLVFWRLRRTAPVALGIGAAAAALSLAMVAAGGLFGGPSSWLPAAATTVTPWRAADFLLFAFGVPVGIRGAGLAAMVAAGVLFAAVSLLAAAPRDPEQRHVPLVGYGLLLVLLGGPAPLSPTQSLVLAAGTLALVGGALGEADPLPESDPLDDVIESEPPVAPDP